VVIRETGPWAPAVHALLRHLETTAHPVTLRAMAWRARSAAWMIRHRRLLETALTR
jgi:hypothetical protein